MKIGLDQVDVFVFNAIRLTVSAAVLMLCAIVERRRGIVPTSEITRQQIVVFALMISAIYQLVFLLGVDRTTAGNTALIIATVPMWTAIIARCFGAEKLRRLAWCGLLTSLIGTAIVALQKNDIAIGHGTLYGNLLILGAALVWSGGTVYSRRLLRHISPIQLSASAAIVALPVHILFALGHAESSLPALREPQVWLIVLYSGVLSSGVAQPMWNFGVRHAGAAHAAIVQNLIPLVAIIAAWFTRSERATGPQILGGALILGGLAMMRIRRTRPPAEKTDPLE